MTDPKIPNTPDSESPTVVSPVGARSAQTKSDASDAPTILEPPNVIPLSEALTSLPTSPQRHPHNSPDAPTQLDVRPVYQPAARSAISGQMAVLVSGMMLGGRYEILETLGEGGMGAVYKAQDRELGRNVALKVIRPELASNPDILQRFKQEILLASKVTDRNIIRIYDLGDADGVKFITMEYVQGEDLRAILRRQGKLAPAEAVDIMEQTVSGLSAAHREGIVHRDLKPGNIMRASDGRVLVMDFGLARSLTSDGLTRTGMMLGTMEYMSPEQAQGMEVDARSDIFTVGLILYELLTGTMPFQAESAIASLLKRTQQRAIPVSDIDKNIPGVLSNIVSKCLEKDPALRYQTAETLLADFRAWQGKSPSSKVSVSSLGLWMNRMRELSWSRIALIILLLVATSVGVAWYTIRRQHASAVVAHAPVSVLVVDFQNNTSDPLFDDTLEPMFNVALEGASFINAYSRGKARQLAEKLPNPSQKLDEQTGRLIAVKEGVATIVTGSLSSRGKGYSLSVKAMDAMTGKTLASANAEVANKDELLLQVPKLAAPIRKALGDTTPESVQLAATQGTFVASNMDAVHQYGIAVELQSAGKMQEAFDSYSKAAQLDPNLARAYSGMAAVAGNLGHAQDAEKYAKLAMEHLDRITERERYSVRGLYYITTENWQKCVEEYGELTKQYPASAFGHSNLAFCYGRLLEMPKAMEEAQQAVQIAQKDVTARMNFALYSCYASDFPRCEREVHEVLQINPSYEEAFLSLAYARIGQNRLPQASEAYQNLEKVSAWGKSLSASGMGDLALYQGRFREGAQALDNGAAADLTAKNADAAADKFVMLAYANLLRGDKHLVVAAAERALANSQSAKVRFLVAREFAEVGESARAQKLANDLASGLQAQPQAYAKLVLGEAALKEHDPRRAIQLFTEAKGLLDTWIGRLDLGRAYLEAGAFAEADAEFDRCIKRRGEALELFQDDMPTSSYLPIAYYYQGRVREGLKSADYKDFYRMYLDLRGKSTEDPLLPEVRRRLGP